MKRFQWICLIVLLTACNGNGSPASTPATGPVQPLQASLMAEGAFPRLRFTNPLFITHAGDGSNRLFVVEQAGRIRVFPNDPSAASAGSFLDISGRVLSGGEMGLLGLAFDPNYAANGFFYVNYTLDNPRRTRVSRFRVSTADPNTADSGSETVLLEFAQPFSNHNGGMLAFGPDGKLYVSSGDGGSGNDPENNAQSLSTPLGKILRINPDGSVPAENPFTSTAGARGEIWAYGLRNPWRMSFDRLTGRLWAGDVGQNAREEIDIIVRGGNYGWRVYEGARANINPDRLPLSAFIAPIHEYDHSQGRSITGGYVYRGPGLPAFQGAYFYADFISGRVWALVSDGNAGTVVSNTQVATIPNPSSFGEDEAGELYVTSFDGNIYRFRQL